MSSRNSHELNKGKIIGPSVAVMLSAAALYAGSFFLGLPERSGDMSKKEDQIATDLEHANFNVTGDRIDVIVDCGISAFEEPFLKDGTTGYAIRLPNVKEQVMHIRDKYCDSFIENNPDSIAYLLYAYGYTNYGIPESDMCLVTYGNGLANGIAAERFPNDASAQYKLSNAIIKDDKGCEESFSEIVG